MFVLSIFFIFLSSYFILSLVMNKNFETKGKTDLLYFLLIAFSQIVLSFEILSLFKAINKTNFFVCNVILFIVSLIIFKLKKKTFYKPYFNYREIIKALKKDKILMFMGICFTIFLFFKLISIIFLPVTFGDALGYYLPRATMWIYQGSISHYITPDSRELIMPVNMDFLYTWKLLFTKNETGISIFSFLGYVCSIYVLYNLLRELNFNIKRSLWSVFVFSSFALVIVEMITPCSDLFIGALLSGAIYLYIKSVKLNHKIALYFSSLALALAIGTKTTALIAFPSVILVMVLISCILKRDNKIKYLYKFFFFFIINFIIFSSYNYILNIIEFSNPVSNTEQLLLNQFKDGFQGYISNIIKYLFAIFDMSGMPFDINGLLNYWQNLLLKVFGLTIKTGTSKYFPHYFEFNSTMSMTNSFLGFLGLFVFAPSIIFVIKRLLKRKTSGNISILSVFALSLLVNLLIFSGIMVYTSFNMRYILTFVVIASPVIAYSYPIKNKLYKIFICLTVFWYFICYIPQKTFSFIENLKSNIKYEEQNIYDYFINKQPSNIALIADQTKSPIYFIEKLRLNNFVIDKILIENIENYNLAKYDYIITNKTNVTSTNIVNFKEKMKYNDLFISRCWYNDKEQNLIQTYYENKIPVMVECQVPFVYIKFKGFMTDKNYLGNKYEILEKSHTDK